MDNKNITLDGRIFAQQVVKAIFDRGIYRGGFVSDKELTCIASKVSNPYDLKEIDTSLLKEKLEQEGFAYNSRRRGYENRKHFG